jgi:DNA-binding winged helix-turn-helix (wHTH) protein/TolB-like protein
MGKQAKHFYEFGPFRLDVAERLLLRDGELIPLTPKVFDTLLLLIENRGQALERQELLRKLWPDAFVDEGNLSQNISILRKALGDNTDGYRYIETLPKRGYRFVAEVAELEIGGAPKTRRRMLAAAILAAVMAAVVLLWARNHSEGKGGSGVPSLAVLPLRPLKPGSEKNLLGLVIADGIIARVSRIDSLRVRPTSAVRKYLDYDGDPLENARELKVDSLLDGTFQRAGDRLRVSVNLLRTADAESVWAETFDVPLSNFFEVQDEVSRQIVTRLRLTLTAAEQAFLVRRDTSSAEAHEYYLKGMKVFATRHPWFSSPNRLKGSGMEPTLESAIALFQKAIEIDPTYARARVKLADSCAWMGLHVEMENPKWLERAEEQLRRAQELDPLLAEVHLVRYEILTSGQGGFKVEEAVRELELARQLDPSVGRLELGVLYAHFGLEKQAIRELERGIEIDPMDLGRQSSLSEGYRLLGRTDEAIAQHWRFWNQPGPTFALISKRRLDEAEPQVKRRLALNPDSPYLIGAQALILALRGRFAEAEAQIPASRRLRNHSSYHHAAYDFAAIYAIQGRAPSALKWLRETVETGMPNYLLFSRDPNLDPIRQDPEFIRFMAEMKTRWEGYQVEFR